MLSRCFAGPGNQKGKSYFHPEEGLVDYIKQNVSGPYWLEKEVFSF